MKYAEYPKSGLLGTVVGIVVVVILFGLLLFGIWTDPLTPIWGKIVTTIVIAFFGGGLTVIIIGGYKAVNYETFFGSGKK